MQTTVNKNIGFGVPGSIYDNGPLRSRPALLNTTDPTNNVPGRIFSVTALGDAGTGLVETRAAGAVSGAFVQPAMLIDPKAYIARGTSAGGSLAPSFALANGEIGEFGTMGSFVVQVAAGFTLTGTVLGHITTGVISVGTADANNIAIPGAKVERWVDAAAGLAVITLTN